MRKIAIVLLFVLAMCFATSCVTDDYVVHRTYQSEPLYYCYPPRTYVYVHPRPHYYHFGYYHPKPHHFPFHSHSQHVQPPMTPPKPTTVPKASVRQGNNGGSMSGTNRRR